MNQTKHMQHILKMSKNPSFPYLLDWKLRMRILAKEHQYPKQLKKLKTKAKGGRKWDQDMDLGATRA